MVEWVIEECCGCELMAPNKTKPIINPIVSWRCLERSQIDLMDFHSRAEDDYKWIIQIKDHFSHYVWANPVERKTEQAVADIMVTWFVYNGRPQIL